jgi:apyrase
MIAHVFIFVLCKVVAEASPLSTESSAALRGNMTHAQQQVHNRDSFYGLVIDAGSSGSRVRMFNWTLGPKVDLAEILPLDDDEGGFEVHPGLSDYAENPSDALAGISSLIQAAAKYIPKSVWKESRLFLKATAGMRLLPTKKAKNVMNAMRDFLANSGNCPFKFVSAEIISGEEEAVYAFLTTNYNLGNLETPSKMAGALEMGGASMQASFKPMTGIQDHEFQFYLEQELFSVYAKSYIRFGINEALTRSMSILAQGSFAEVELASPCHNRGFKQELTLSSGRQQVFVGTGNVSACKQVVRKMMGLDIECLMPPCAIFGSYMPPVSGQFYAFAAFFYTANGLGLVGWNDAKALSPNDLSEATETFCSKDLTTAVRDSGGPMKFVQKYCFMGVYAQQRLLAMGFQQDARSVIFSRKLHGLNLGFPAGAMLYETQLMPLSLELKNSDGVRSLCGHSSLKRHSEHGHAANYMLSQLVFVASLLLGSL